jgi:hypothetical protein
MPRAELIGVLAAAIVCSAAPQSSPWLERDFRFRVRVETGAAGVAEIAWQWQPPAALRVVQVAPDGAVLNRSAPFQFEAGRNAGTLILAGKDPNSAASFDVYFRPGLQWIDLASSPSGPLKTTEVEYQGQRSLRFETPPGTYMYHLSGGGFAALLDGDGNDWIGYKPQGIADGSARGIPNLIYPGDIFHPGTTAATTTVVHKGPLKVTLRSEVDGGKLACQWEIYPWYARLTVLAVDRPYWFLYEGTPGGKLDLNEDFWVRSPGDRLPVSEQWNGRIPPPRWAYFGDPKSRYVLFLAHHEDDGETDQFYQMREQMTVFGFGRKLRCCEKSLRKTPARFTIGLAATAPVGELARLIEAAMRDTTVRPGRLEKR